jgi:PmbA protein
MSDLEFAKSAVAAAVAAGATAADAAVVAESGIEVRVRLGEVERVEQSQARSLGVRAFRGHRLGLSYTNDLSPQGARRAAERAAELAAIAAEDPAAGLPDAADVGALATPLDLVDPAVDARTVEEWRDAARAAEEAARSRAGITMSDGARAGGGHGRVAFANSVGFAGERERTSVHVFASVIAAGSSGERLRGGWVETATHWSDLGGPEAVGHEAARRALEQIGWKRPPTGSVPVVLAPEIARDFARSLAQALSAAELFRRSTFLADAVGERVASEALSLVDDATLPRRAGSRPFDGEGVLSRRNVLLERGRLASRIANSYAARRTESRTTGNAARNATGDTSVAPTNLVLVPGERTPEAVIASVGEGLYVTDLFHFGVNLTTGAWSRGGSGRWISGGALAHPVQEMTIAGDLRHMLLGFREAANDLTWQGGCAAPTVVIDGLTVGAAG